MKCFKKSFLVVFCCFFSLLFSISSSIPTHAIDLNPANLELVGWNATPCTRLAHTVHDEVKFFSEWARSVSIKGGSFPVGYIRIGGGPCGETMWVRKYSYVQIILTVTGPNGRDVPSIMKLQKNGDFEPISHRIISSVDYPQGHMRMYEIIGKYVGIENPSSFVIAGPNQYSAWAIFSQPTNPNDYYGFWINSVTSWLPKGDGSVAVTSELSKVGNKISEVAQNTNNSTQKINETLETIKKNHEESIVAQNNNTNAINNQTEQQKDQHDQEKKEEKDRENKGNDQSSKLGSIFNFTILNPFSGLYALFSPGSCKPIPTLGKLLNKPDATYCPWFPENVRSVLTPVIALSSMILIFGFTMRWLTGSSLNGAISIGGKK